MLYEKGIFYLIVEPSLCEDWNDDSTISSSKRGGIFFNMIINFI